MIAPSSVEFHCLAKDASGLGFMLLVALRAALLSVRRRLRSVHVKSDGSGVGPPVELVAELVGHPEASDAAFVFVGRQEPSQRLGEVTVVADLADHRRRGDPQADGGRCNAVFEGVAGDFADGEHKVFAPGGGQAGAGPVTAYALTHCGQLAGMIKDVDGVR